MNKGISLHIGVGKLSTKWYRSEAMLCSPANDAKAMAGIARQEGYDQIQIFTNEEATRENFMQAVSDSAFILSSGDTFLLTFSGHGGQQEDIDGDEMDGKDETWCFYDTHVLDDEIGTLWKKFKKGVRVIVVSASCHSRSSIKPYPIALPFWQSTKAITNPVAYAYPEDPQIQASILHLSACDDRREARDGEQFPGSRKSS